MTKLYKLKLESLDSYDADKKELLDDLITTANITELHNPNIEGLNPVYPIMIHQMNAISWMDTRETIHNEQLHPL